jgi:DNA-binding CsgD family transcriptional regulator
LERLGEARERVGEKEAAIAVWSEANECYQRDGDMTAVARLRRQLALLEMNRGRIDSAEAQIEAGLTALADQPPSEIKVDLLYARVLRLLLFGRFAGMENAAAELWKLADQPGLKTAEAHAWLGQASLHTVNRHFSAAHECALRGLAAAERSGEVLVTRHAHNFIAMNALASGDHQLLSYHAEQSLRLSRQLGAPTLEPMPRWHLAYADMLRGDLEAAQRRAFEASMIARRVDQKLSLAQSLAMGSVVLALRGDLVEAASSLSEAKEIFADESAVERTLSWLISIGDLAIALEHDNVESLRSVIRMFAPSDRLTAIGLPALLIGLVGEALVAVGSIEAALGLARELAEHDPTDQGYSAALAMRVEGRARESLGDRKAAQACHEKAASLLTELEMRFDAARSRLDWATLMADEDPAFALRAAQTCLRAFEEAGARLYVLRTRRLFSRMRVHPSSGARSSPVVAAPQSRTRQLSARELEVARLVAEGLTSADIAERLTISTRTVTTHLERIYARLGINSRAALVRYISETVLWPVQNRIT